MTTALYIALGVLAAALVAIQFWIARSSASLAGTRSRGVLALRSFNIVLLVAAFALVVYYLVRG